MDAAQIATRRSDILSAFEGFREDLDEHNDRSEATPTSRVNSEKLTQARMLRRTNN